MNRIESFVLEQAVAGDEQVEDARVVVVPADACSQRFSVTTRTVTTVATVTGRPSLQ